ncbi:MAG TPA: hypothetical protein O0W88_05010 [Methanocorpusculum sp.]|nr:hypothetical protein [Methanocorpusculum sp.]HJK01563.1 hypothetical protein [Methanocorpusculum sp.]HJK01763.1 hypothetical protein [Methanocorpusculum sp.]
MISVSPDIRIGNNELMMTEIDECVAVERAKMSYAETEGATHG